MADVTVEVDGDVGRLTLNRPAARNAISLNLARELGAGVRELAPQVSVIVIRGAGGTFCAGGDFDELMALRDKGRDALAELFTAFRDATAAIAAAEVPVVAVVEGHAVAGGFELVQAVDVAIAAESATLADIHAKFGQIPGGGGTVLLPRLVGQARASGLVLTGDALTARQALDWGLLYQVVADAELEAAVASLVRRLTKGSRAARAASKRLIREGLSQPVAAALDAELEAVLDHILGAGGSAAAESFATRKKDT
ncbi:MAG TPA: enoyl-CoA hydratase/isomerase family protein [Sporichthyaceae bacterium]